MRPGCRPAAAQRDRDRSSSPLSAAGADGAATRARLAPTSPRAPSVGCRGGAFTEPAMTESQPRLKITYATLRADNEDLHGDVRGRPRTGEDAARRAPPQLRRRPGAGRRRDVRGPLADRPRHPPRALREGHPRRTSRTRSRRRAGAAGLVPARLGEAARDPEARRRADQRAPDGVRRADGDRGRQDPARGARRGRGGGRPDPLLREDGRGQRVLRPPDGQPRRRGGPHPVDPPAARRVRRDQPVQLPDGAGRRPVGGGDDGRQHGRLQAGLGRAMSAIASSRPTATPASRTA